MKKLFAILFAGVLFLSSCGGSNSAKPTPAADYAAACEELRTALTDATSGRERIAECAQKVDKIVTDNADYVMNDHDMDLVTEAFVETSISLYEYFYNPNFVTWMSKAGQIRALKGRTKAELIKMQSFGEVNDLDFTKVYSDILDK